MRSKVFMSVLALAALSVSAPALAAGCANPAALGTSRIMSLDSTTGLALGQQYGAELPLADKEVVLTFDDGPLPIFSEKVRAILEEQCVRATFFLVGRNASAYPDFVRKLASDGHTIASHTMTHNMNLDDKAFEAEGEITKGMAAVDRALKTSTAQPKVAPFFRFPGLSDKPLLRDKMQEQGMAVISIDIEGGDWVKDATSKDVLARLMRQLHEKRKGIVLLHDIQPRTVKMLPEFLAKLKAEGYKVVHLMPAGQTAPADIKVATVGAADIVKTGEAQKMAKPETVGVQVASLAVPVVSGSSFAMSHPKPEKSDDVDAVIAEAKKDFAAEDSAIAAIPDAPSVPATEKSKISGSQTINLERPELDETAASKPARKLETARRNALPKRFSRPIARHMRMEKPQLAVASPDYIQHRRPAASEYFLNSIFNSVKAN